MRKKIYLVILTTIFFSIIFNFKIGTSVKPIASGGMGWKQVRVAPGPNQELPGLLVDILMINDSKGFIVGHKGQIYYTEIGPEIWQNKSLDGDLNDYYCLDLVEDMLFIGGYNVLMKVNITTFDYTQLSLPENDSVRTIQMINLTHGWYAGEHDIFYTENGGLNWTKINLPILPAVEDSIYFSSFEDGLVIGMDYSNLSRCLVLKSYDRFNTWNTIELNGAAWLFTMDFVNSSVGYMSVNRSSDNKLTIWKTIDGGYNWIDLNYTFDGYGAQDIEMVDENYGWVLSYNLYLTKDGGNTWLRQVAPKMSITPAIFALNQSHAYIIGNGINTTEGYIDYTTNGGNLIPTVEITNYPTSAKMVNEEINFEAFISTCDFPFTAVLDFGDGTNQTITENYNSEFILRSTHKYSQPGNYTVKLSVTDATLDISSDEVIIEIIPRREEISETPNIPGFNPFLLIGISLLGIVILSRKINIKQL